MKTKPFKVGDRVVVRFAEYLGVFVVEGVFSSDMCVKAVDPKNPRQIFGGKFGYFEKTQKA